MPTVHIFFALEQVGAWETNKGNVQKAKGCKRHKQKHGSRESTKRKAWYCRNIVMPRKGTWQEDVAVVHAVGWPMTSTASIGGRSAKIETSPWHTTHLLVPGHASSTRARYMSFASSATRKPCLGKFWSFSGSSECHILQNQVGKIETMSKLRNRTHAGKEYVCFGDASKLVVDQTETNIYGKNDKVQKVATFMRCTFSVLSALPHPVVHTWGKAPAVQHLSLQEAIWRIWPCPAETPQALWMIRDTMQEPCHSVQRHTVRDISSSS